MADDEDQVPAEEEEEEVSDSVQALSPRLAAPTRRATAGVGGVSASLRQKLGSS